jgi:hypothetical protein
MRTTNTSLVEPSSLNNVPFLWSIKKV